MKKIIATLNTDDIFSFLKGSIRSTTAKTWGFDFFVVSGNYVAVPKLG
jgi:serine protease inhibitor ecotin